MALKLEEDEYTHVIAIDFGTGASGYGIAPRFYDKKGSHRIEVFNPCDDSDDQKTPTSILFTNEGKFVDFGSQAMATYAEILDDGNTALLFQGYKMHLLHMHANAKSLDGRELPLITVIAETLRYISERAVEKLTE